VPGDSRRSSSAGARALARFDRRKARAFSVDPDFYDLDFEALWLRTDDGLRLSSWFVPPPAGESADLMVLMHHHYGGQKAALLPWIDLFHRLGVGVLAFDARDHAQSPCPSGSGAYVHRFADVRAGFDELLRRGVRRVVGYGQSQGGAVLLGGLAHRPELAGVILDSGPSASALLSLWGLARELPEQEGPTAQWLAGLIVGELLRRMQPWTYPWHLWRGLLRLRQRPLLWLHGTEDRVIPAAWVELWFQPLRRAAPAWRRMLVPGAQHAECLQLGGAAVEARVGELLRAAGRDRSQR
jgi:alpha-beta hydrolase superfamily lysophospholipase